jgi:DNA end-binding protein Ku
MTLPGGEKAYALLFSAMKNKNVWGVARIGMHRREHILILRLAENGLVAHTMFMESEVRKIPEFRTDCL